MEIPNHLTCLLRNLYSGQEATVRNGHGTRDWFQIGRLWVQLAEDCENRSFVHWLLEFHSNFCLCVSVFPSQIPLLFPLPKSTHSLSSCNLSHQKFVPSSLLTPRQRETLAQRILSAWNAITY